MAFGDRVARCDWGTLEAVQPMIAGRLVSRGRSLMCPSMGTREYDASRMDT